MQKRIFTILLIVVMLVGSLPIYANTSEITTTNQRQEDTLGEKLRSYGILEGDEFGNLMEDKALTRAELMVLISRLNKVETEAKNTEYKKVFSDVKPTDWYAPYITYSQRKKWTNGYPNGTFKPNQLVTDKEFYRFMLNVLNYTVDEISWDETMEKAQELEITTDVKKKNGVLRKESFEVLFNTLKNKPRKSNSPLGKKLKIKDFMIPNDNLDVKYVQSLSDKILKVTLDDEQNLEMIDVLNKDYYEILNKKGVKAKVEKIEISEWDDKTLLVHLEKELNSSDIFTLNYKHKDFKQKNFRPKNNSGGSSSNSSNNREELEISKVSSLKYNKVKIEFNKDVKKDIDLEIFETYHQNRDLEIENISYGDNSKEIILTTDNQESGTLYTLKINKAISFYGLKLEDVEKSFSGKDIPDDKLKITEVVLEDFETIIVFFEDNLEVNKESININDFEVKENYSNKRIDIKNVTLLEDASLYTKAFRANENSALILKVKDLKKSTLYKLTIDELESEVGNSIDSDYDNVTFVGQEKPDEELTYLIHSLSNTKIKLIFSEKISENALELDNYFIENSYFDEAVEIVSIEKLNDKELLFTLNGLNNTLYELQVENVEDIYGNSLDENYEKRTFAGRNELDEVDSVRKIYRNNEGQLVVELNEKLEKDSAENIENYSINNHVGYPHKVELQDDLRTIVLDIPFTQENKLYTLTIENLRNLDNVIMDDEIEVEFAGNNQNDNSLIEIKSVIAKDTNTLIINFSEDVHNERIEGVIWDEKTNALLGKILFKEKNSNYVKTLKDLGYSFIEASNNSLIISFNNELFKPLNNNDTYFIKINTQYMDNDENEKEFASTTQELSSLEVRNVQSLNERLLKVTLSEPVRIYDFYDALGEIEVIGENYDGEITNVYNLDEKTYFFTLDKSLDSDVYTLVFSEETADRDGISDILDKTGNKTFKLDDNEYTVDFAGNNSDYQKNIKDIDVLSLNRRTLEVYFNDVEVMGESVYNPSNYDVFTSEDKPYSDFSNHERPSFVEYVKEENKAILYFSQDISDNNDMEHYVSFNNNNLKDASNYRHVSKDNGDVLYVQYALNAETNDELKILDSDLSRSGNIITLTFNQPIAFTTDKSEMSSSNELKKHEFSLKNDGYLTFYKENLKDWFKVSGQTTNSDALEIYKVQRVSEEKVKIYLNDQAKKLSKITLSLENSSTYKVVDKNNFDLLKQDLEHTVAVYANLEPIQEDYFTPEDFNVSISLENVTSKNVQDLAINISNAEIGTPVDVKVSQEDFVLTGDLTLEEVDNTIDDFDLTLFKNGEVNIEVIIYDFNKEKNKSFEFKIIRDFDDSLLKGIDVIEVDNISNKAIEVEFSDKIDEDTLRDALTEITIKTEFNQDIVSTVEDIIVLDDDKFIFLLSNVLEEEEYYLIFSEETYNNDGVKDIVNSEKNTTLTRENWYTMPYKAFDVTFETLDIVENTINANNDTIELTFNQEIAFSTTTDSAITFNEAIRINEFPASNHEGLSYDNDNLVDWFMILENNSNNEIIIDKVERINTSSVKVILKEALNDASKFTLTLKDSEDNKVLNKINQDVLSKDLITTIQIN